MSVYDRTKKIFILVLILLLSFRTGHAEDGPLVADDPQELSPETQAETSFYYLKDNDQTKLFQWRGSVEQNINDRFSVRYGYARLEAKENGTSEIHENQQLLSVHYRDAIREASVSYKYRDFSNAEEGHNYALAYTSPLFGIDSVSLHHSYEHEEKTRAIRAGVKKFSQSVSVYQDLFTYAYGTGMYRYDDYNDGNSRNTASAGLFGRLMRNPEIAIGYEFSYDYSKFDSPDYWTPRLQRLHQARLVARGSVFQSKLSYDVSAAVGHVAEKGEENHVANSATVSLTYALTESSSIFFSYDRYLTATYRSRTAQGGLRIKF
jgi:hypothetical protein